MFANSVTAFASRRITNKVELPEKISSFYECSFDVELDNSFKSSWVYDVSDNGNLHITLKNFNNMGFGADVLLTLKGKSTMQLLNLSESMLNVGNYRFIDTMHVIESGYVVNYVTDDSPYLRFDLVKTDGKTSIKFYLTDGDFESGRGLNKLSSVIDVDEKSIKENGNARYLFIVNGNYTPDTYIVEDDDIDSSVQPKEEELPPNLQSKYTCSFDIKLDNTFKDSWIYDVSDNGNVHITLIHIGNKDLDSSVLLVAEGKSKMYLGETFGRDGFYSQVYRFNDQYNVLKDGRFYQYHNSQPKDGDRSDYGFTIRLYKKDGKPTVQAYLQKRDWDMEKKIITNWETISSVIDMMPSSFADKGEAESIFFVDEEVPVDYSGTSVDPRVWDDKEKSIEAYGRYRDDDGTFHSVKVFRGKFRDLEYDYDVNITAKFMLQLPNSAIMREISNNNFAEVTYYNMVQYIEGKAKEDIQLVKLTGDKGTRWFMSGNLEVRKSDPRFEIDESSMLTDDNSIYLGFIPLERFENDRAEYLTGDSEILSFTFKYNDNTKTAMKSIHVNWGGKSSEIPLEDIDYSGGFINYFLKKVYPNIYSDIAKGLGLNI